MKFKVVYCIVYSAVFRDARLVAWSDQEGSSRCRTVQYMYVLSKVDISLALHFFSDGIMYAALRHRRTNAPLYLPNPGSRKYQSLLSNHGCFSHCFVFSAFVFQVANITTRLQNSCPSWLIL